MARLGIFRNTWTIVGAAGIGLYGREQADSCGIVGVVGKDKETDARGFLLEGLQAWERLFSHLYSCSLWKQHGTQLTEIMGVRC